MNFDQKAVKFLANFYINGGKHWTHGPLRQKRPEAALLSWDADEKSPTSPKRTPMGWRSFVGSTGECPLTRTRTLRGLLLEQRPPLLADPDVPGPAEYAPRAFLREICPHLHYSIGCRHPGPDSGGRRAWHSAWLQSESPFTRKVDFNLERQWPSPADHVPPSPPVGPAFSFGVRARPGPLRVQTPSARFLVQGPPRVPGEQRPGPTAYDVRAGCRLQRPRPPAFSRSGSPAFAAGLRASCTPGPAAYHVEDCYDSRFPSAPGVVIQGVRRPKRHDTGPFCAL
ncbi:protein STPG3 isoform X3 [Heterocephalus glaber]|uniref:Protein STPG3 isoform X3 n=1 Tax=Heterocephalus glaber TaxID=10181 RepID=A0AAX6PCK1_HETGA|nr:protein STPG3 isoform X3 [Heterocephalus glaber]